MTKMVFIIVYFVSFFYLYSMRNEKSVGELNIFQKTLGFFALFGLGVILMFGFNDLIDIFPIN